MTYAREKRLLLGLSALLAPLPLPFNQMLEWVALALFEAAVVIFLLRAAREPDSVHGSQSSGRWLSNRSLNLLGLAYLPVLVLDIAVTGRIQMLRPVLHLALFAVLAKLWALRDEKQKWQTWMGIFFLFLASMATSVHPSVILYLIVFLSLTVVLMVRFVYLHVLASFGHRELEPPHFRYGPSSSAQCWRPWCWRCRSLPCCRGSDRPTSWPREAVGGSRSRAPASRMP